MVHADIISYLFFNYERGLFEMDVLAIIFPLKILDFNSVFIEITSEILTSTPALLFHKI